MCEGTGNDLNIGRLDQETRIGSGFGMGGGGVIFHIRQCHVNELSCVQKYLKLLYQLLTTQYNVKICFCPYKIESVHIKVCFCSRVFS